MSDTLLIQVTNQKAIGLLHELEALNLIKVLKSDPITTEPKRSSKYRGSISKEQGKDLRDHINQMRNEWNNS